MRKVSLALDSEAPLRLLPSGRATGESSGQRGSLSPALAFILEETQREISLTRVNGATDDVGPSTGELHERVGAVAQRLGFDLSNFERDQVVALLEREQRPFGILQELVDDPTVSDIIVSSYQRVSVQRGRTNIATAVKFATHEAYQAFVERLLYRAGTTYSTRKPIADGMIGALARVHAVHESVCESGPYLTIRLNRFSRVALEDLLQAGLAPQPVLAYLRGMVRGGCTALLVGEVGTGKTTLARGLAGSIPPEESILVIEDTPEIRLEHPHVRYMTTREANVEGAGRLSPSECIRAGMRMAMNRIIFGEMRDAEAAESFVDVCVSGHPGLSTIHARSAAEAVVRLELFLGRAQRGVERRVLTEQIATAVQVIVHLGVCPLSGHRRVLEVVEIGPVADGVLRTREMFRYAPLPDRARWMVVGRSSAHRAMLESADEPVILSSLGGELELPEQVQFREAQESAMRLRARGVV